jgi:hypothetical protein
MPRHPLPTMTTAFAIGNWLKVWERCRRRRDRRRFSARRTAAIYKLPGDGRGGVRAMRAKSS